MRKLRVILILMLYEYHHFFLMKFEYLMIVFESKLCGQLQRLFLLKEEGIKKIQKRKWRRRGSRERRIDMLLWMLSYCSVLFYVVLFYAM